MKFVKRLLMVAGAVALAGLMGTMIAPKAAHGIVATLVEIVPGATTHVGTTESQLIWLHCTGDNVENCYQVTQDGSTANSPYQVPSNNTLVVTDWLWMTKNGFAKSQNQCDDLELISTTTIYDEGMQSCNIADSTGTVAANVHFTTGIRVPSGYWLTDTGAIAGVNAEAQVLGYLVPNN